MKFLILRINITNRWKCFPLRSTKLWSPQIHFCVWNLKSNFLLILRLSKRFVLFCKQVIEVDVSFNFIIKPKCRAVTLNCRGLRFRKACHKTWLLGNYQYSVCHFGGTHVLFIHPFVTDLKTTVDSFFIICDFRIIKH